MFASAVPYTWSGKPARPVPLIIAIVALIIGLLFSLAPIFQAITLLTAPEYDQMSMQWTETTRSLLIVSCVTFVVMLVALIAMILGHAWGRIVFIVIAVISIVANFVLMSVVLTPGEVLASSFSVIAMPTVVSILILLPSVSAYFVAMQEMQNDRATQRG